MLDVYKQTAAQVKRTNAVQQLLQLQLQQQYQTLIVMNFAMELTLEMLEIVVMLATVIAPVKKKILVLKTKFIVLTINPVKVLEVKLVMKDLIGAVLMKFQKLPVLQQ